MLPWFLFVAAAVASPLSPPDPIDACTAVREPLVDHVARRVIQARYPYGRVEIGDPPESAPVLDDPAPRGVVLKADLPDAIRGPVRGPGDHALGRLASDGRRIFVAGGGRIQVYSAAAPHRRLGVLPGDAVRLVDGVLLTVDSVRDQQGEPVPWSRRNFMGDPQSHLLHATRIAAWDVSGDLPEAPRWTVDVEGGLLDLSVAGGRVHVLTGWQPTPSNTAWKAAFGLDEGMPEPVPGPGATYDPAERARYAEVVAEAEDVLRNRLDALPIDALLAPRGRHRLGRGPWEHAAASCADLPPGAGGADVFVQLVSVDLERPEQAHAVVQPMVGGFARQIRVDSQDGTLWLASSERGGGRTVVHAVDLDAAEPTWTAGSLRGTMSQALVAAEDGRALALQRTWKDGVTSVVALAVDERGLERTAPRIREPGLAIARDGSGWAVPGARGVYLLDGDGVEDARIAVDGWSLGESVALGGARLVSATRLVERTEASEVGPARSTFEHALLLVGTDGHRALSATDRRFHDRVPGVRLWKDPAAERVLVQLDAEHPSWCTPDGCTPWPRPKGADGLGTGPFEVLLLGDTTLAYHGDHVIARTGSREARLPIR